MTGDAQAIAQLFKHDFILIDYRNIVGVIGKIFCHR